MTVVRDRWQERGEFLAGGEDRDCKELIKGVPAEVRDVVGSHPSATQVGPLKSFRTGLESPREPQNPDPAVGLQFGQVEIDLKRPRASLSGIRGYRGLKGHCFISFRRLVRLLRIRL